MFEFKKSHRLLNKADYDYVFEQAKKIITKDFIVLFRKNNLGYARLGLALSKKMIAKAHDRNRIKRLLREGFRQSHLPAVDMVFLAKSGIATETKSGMTSRLSKLWEQLTASYDK